MISFEKSVGSVVFRREGEKILYLLVQYRWGHWEFPRGYVEVGETEEETMRREVFEETGICDLEIVPGFREKMHFFYRAKGEEKEKRIASGRKINIFKRVIFYLAETKADKVILSHEQLDYQWLEYVDAVDSATYRNAKKILRLANKRLKG